MTDPTPAPQEYTPRDAQVIHQRIVQQLATELGVQPRQVSVTMELIDGGATVPFIARYRKEVTGGLDDTVLRQLEVRLLYLQELEARRDVIASSIAQQGKLSASLAKEVEQADSKQRLEDLYAPYKPKRRTRAQIAREAGLQPLADTLLGDPDADPKVLAAQYVDADKGVATEKAALDGARDILAEQFAEDADLVARLRALIAQKGQLYAKVIEGKESEGANFRDWFDFSEPLRSVPSHRMLAMLRGRQQGVLDLRVALPEAEEALVPHPCIRIVAEHNGLDDGVFGPHATPRQQWLADVSRWAWRVKLAMHFEMEFISQLREQAETEAIRVFAANLKDLLLAPPAGTKAVMGLDPGIRTGVKVAAIDTTGKVVETATIYPFEPRRDVNGSLQTLARIVRQHKIELVAIGNGTASRETERLVARLCELQPDLDLARMVISEAGASVYSASELAAKEFPDLDVSLRGAVSIARRLQDPLAELVKIEPKAIGVGQYQHDVNQRELGRSLDAVVEDCVNAVGVDVNTASPALLTHVSGLNATLARNIVQYRDSKGAFRSRKQLMEVPRFGEKAFEQAAGFLRISGGDNPLDASSVHPEAYPVVEKILARIQADVKAVMGNQAALKGLSPSEFTDERFGVPTVTDILAELEKPGRDPRPEFKTVKFEDGIESIDDLKVGLILEGVVTNVANFGAFVDIGVHQDGLVHISALSERFVKDPRDVVRTGQSVKVKVLEVDKARKRIALTMRLSDDAPARTADTKPSGGSRQNRGAATGRAAQPAPQDNAMAAAFAKLKR
ncbi:Tex family protein [Orrella marina]|uniref:RNA-binding transcriptional accessory protein n=1 Tax=Orrella marina TaxID=2163011 RepID=A0A2R4XPE4_9BURK|nr:Tex family protein [Orrella marina]AWB35641.1 RNA-binding transcriptional accessory protein [Orrella marina]